MSPDDPPSRLTDDLRRLLGDDAVIAGPLGADLYRRDASMITTEAECVVCLPDSVDQVPAIVTVAARHGRSVVARGAGTGLTGGAVPVDSSVIVATPRLDSLIGVDVENRVARVGPGMINLELSRRLESSGLHFAPDPSSQQSCTVGGNIANNSGGPHCLADGVTTAHVRSIDLVLGDGSVVCIGGEEPEPIGYDLRALAVGSEGTLGVITEAVVGLLANPPAAATLLAGFDTVAAAAEAVGSVIAAGIVPAALEMIEGEMIGAVNRFCAAGFPVDAAAVLLTEVDGLREGVALEAARVEELLAGSGATSVRLANDADERARWWKGRKSAFGAVARIAPNYYLHDTVVPRRALAPVLAATYEIAARHDLMVMNVFHAGDGNLHPLLVFDAAEPGVLERVHRAGAEIVAASLDAGGVLTGEHGIGIEKARFMSWYFTESELAVQARVLEIFDPDGVCNPGKVLPIGRSCGEPDSGEPDDRVIADPGAAIPPRRRTTTAAVDRLADEVGDTDAIWIHGAGSHLDASSRPAASRSAREVTPPAGIVSYEPEEMILRVLAGTTVAEVQAMLGDHRQHCILPTVDPTTTVGGAIAVGSSGLDRLGRGPLRDCVLEATCVDASGHVIRSGGPVVKNVTGFDLVRLHVGAWGTLGVIGEVVLRALPLPDVTIWLRAEVRADEVLSALYRPVSVLWDGVCSWVQLAGCSADIASQRQVLAGLGTCTQVEGPPALGPHRWSVPPNQIGDVVAGIPAAVAEAGVGIVHANKAQDDRPLTEALELLQRRTKHGFDPRDRLNPGLDLLGISGRSPRAAR